MSYSIPVLCCRDRLSCQLYSGVQIFLLGPFNVASYALLTLMVAQVTGYKPGDFVHTLGDAHIYLNHIDQVKLQLKREPYKLLRCQLILKYRYPQVHFSDFTLSDYVAHPHIKGDISI